MKKITSLWIYTTLILFSCQIQKENNTAHHNHSEMMQAMGNPKKDIKTIGILLYDGFTTLDAMGPYQVLTEMMGTEVFFVAKQKGIIKNMNGVGIEVTKSINDIEQLDMLLIPGGFRETLLATHDTTLLNWIKRIDKSTQITASVCTGAWILGSTDLLRGKKVTTHWYRGAEIMALYGAEYQEERWVQDGKYWTSAGVSAGIDMCLAIVKEIRGENYLKLAMLDLEYDPKPPISGGSVK